MSKKGLVKSTGIIGIATAASRILGFVRDIVIAGFFGTNPSAQAFVVAFRIPNSLRDLVGEGATNAAIVPVLSEYRSLGDEREFVRVSKILFNISFVVLSALALIGIVFSPLIVRLIAPGFVVDSEKFALTVTLNRVIFPYLVLIGLTAYAMGVLNAMNHFASPAFGPVFLNIALIASAVWLCPKIGVMGLVIGVLAGGVLQLGLSMPFLYRRGIRIDFQEGFRHASVARIGRLLVPRAVGSAVYQINIFVDTILASLAWIVGQGGVAALYYANRLIQFPLGIFGIALAQAALPKMSQEFAQDDITSFKDTLCFSLRIVSLIMIPAGFGLAILGRPIIRLLFERGEFTPYSTSITQDALFYYSFGMLAYAGIKLLVSAFYSMHDTMTPVKTASAAVILNIILNVVLMFPLKLGGLALATSISAMSNFVMLFLLLRKRIGDFGSRRIADSFLRAVMASLVMSAVLICFIIACGSFGFLELAVSILAGGVAFILAGYIFGITEIRDFIVWIIKRR